MVLRCKICVGLLGFCLKPAPQHPSCEKQGEKDNCHQDGWKAGAEVVLFLPLWCACLRKRCADFPLNSPPLPVLGAFFHAEKVLSRAPWSLGACLQAVSFNALPPFAAKIFIAVLFFASRTAARHASAVGRRVVCRSHC